MRAKLYLLLALPLLLLLVPALPAGAQPSSDDLGEDPALWPEAQRSFFQDGPGLLMTAEQRTELRTLNEDARERAIQEFLDKDPIPETTANELTEGIERRRRLADSEIASPSDVRWQLIFLNGKPAEKMIIDCGQAFKPLEVWTYPSHGVDPATGKPIERSLVVYRPGAGEPFRLWLPSDSKRALYIPQMEYWLMQWEELRGRIQAVRFDIQTCRESTLKIDKATGVPGLTGAKASKGFTVRPIDNSSYLETPRDLAVWARAAAATDAPPAPPPVEVRSFQLAFPERDGQRIRMHAQVEIDPQGLQLALSDPDEKNGTQVYTLAVQAVLEQNGRPFDEFRLRYRVPEQYANPLVLAIDRSVRPNEPFVLRLHISDERGEAETRLAQGFQAPTKPIPGVAPVKAAAGELVPGDVVHGADALVLLPPPADVVLGLWRAEAIVTGERIKKVVFKVDGVEQLTRTAAPFSAELRLARFPTEQVVRAEGFDEKGDLVAADEVIINQPRGALSVWITDPPKGTKVTGNRVQVKAEVMIPDGRRIETMQFLLNDQVASSLTKPPWQADLTLPSDDVVYVTAVAILDDGTRAEAVRFLRSPQYMEEVDVNLVELYVTVTDRNNQLITGLTQNDFEVLEGGQRQEISKFELVENRPLTIGMLLDTSGSMAQSLAQAQSAAAGFLRSVLKPRDKAFAVSFSSQTRLDMPPTDDVEGLALALSGLQAVGDTALHDAIVHSLYYFRGMTGQRALVLLSDGDDNASWFKFNDALDYARRSGVAIYVIGFNISSFGTLRGKLEQLANETGGRVYYANKAEEFAGVYTQIEKELRSRYLLAYNAAASSGPAGARPVEVKVKKGGYKTRVSRGVYQ
ncbi:MAG TPA: VWA domain-containing protein [Thermoanaerobaculia bacterium]|nr:VWA domain-containing protein [Thermoanaerobaculia bacterium]